MSTHIVACYMNNVTTAKSEVEPTRGFRPTVPWQVLGQAQDTVDPAVKVAKAALDKVKETKPSQVKVGFGVKASVGSDWFAAKAAAKGGFEITLMWTRDLVETSAVTV